MIVKRRGKKEMKRKRKKGGRSLGKERKENDDC
jgi:hypothetical protein